jgi:hypothetical protein
MFCSSPLSLSSDVCTWLGQAAITMMILNCCCVPHVLLTRSFKIALIPSSRKQSVHSSDCRQLHLVSHALARFQRCVTSLSGTQIVTS